MAYWVLGVVVVLLGLTTFAVLRYGLWNLLIRQPASRVVRLEWEDLGPTPLGEERFTPQGMTYVDGRIVFANSWKNTKSRVYEIASDGMQLLRTFDMPPEAVHTSGLAYDGRHLWAVDFISNRCYKIDLEESLKSGAVHVVGQFSTGLRGTSACCFVELDGKRHLVISDFMNTRRSYVVRHEEAVESGDMASSVVFFYTNEGFSQGLQWDGKYLYESENKWSADVVNQMDLAVLRESGSARRATVRQFNAPSKGVEDLAWDGESFYTSDETTFRFYCIRLIQGD